MKNKTPQDYFTYLETLDLHGLARLDCFAAADFRFRDPFNDIQGIEKFRALMHLMFETMGPIEFVISARHGGDSLCFIEWDLRGRLFGKPSKIHGMSKLTFNAAGLLQEQIDCWDTATGFYEAIPFLGRLFVFLRGRMTRRLNQTEVALDTRVLNNKADRVP